MRHPWNVYWQRYTASHVDHMTVYLRHGQRRAYYSQVEVNTSLLSRTSPMSQASPLQKGLDKYQPKKSCQYISAAVTVRVEGAAELLTHANLSSRLSSTLPFLRRICLSHSNQIHLKMYYTLLGVYQIFLKRLIYSRLILIVHAIHWLVLEI